MSFIVKPSNTHEEWLENRKGVLTATQIGRLMTGGPAEWESVRREFEGEKSSFDNKFMAWGREREPVISQELKIFVDSRLEPNNQFLVSKSDPRIGATPDLISKDGEVIGEIKTSKHPDPGPLADASGGHLAKYYVQVQVQLLVTGAEACVFAWEQHNDEWPDPTPLGTTSQLITPDKEVFEQIRSVVDKFFNGPIDVSETILNDIISELKGIKEQQEDLAQQESKLKDRLIEHLGDRDGFKTSLASVSYYQPKPSSRFDSTAFKKEYPELYAEFIKQSDPGGKRLRITYAKEN